MGLRLTKKMKMTWTNTLGLIAKGQRFSAVHRDQFPLDHRKIGSIERTECPPCKVRRLPNSLIKPGGAVGILPDEMGVQHKKIGMRTKKSVTILDASGKVAGIAIGREQVVGSHGRLWTRQSRGPVKQEIVVRVRAMWVAFELCKIVRPICDNCKVRRDCMVQTLHIQEFRT